MKRLFDALPDETPPTTGAEIGAALAPALAEIAAAGERQAQALGQMLAQAMADVITRAGERPAAPSTHPAQVLRWEFEVVRDDRGRMERVIATAADTHH